MKHLKSQYQTLSRAASRITQEGTRPGIFKPRVVIDPSVVYEDLLPDLAHGNNGFAWACCPFHDDHNPSLCVNVETGWYKCMSSHCGATGRDIVGFVSHLYGYEFAQSRSYLEQHYG